MNVRTKLKIEYIQYVQSKLRVKLTNLSCYFQKIPLALKRRNGTLQVPNVERQSDFLFNYECRQHPEFQIWRANMDKYEWQNFLDFSKSCSGDRRKTSYVIHSYIQQQKRNNRFYVFRKDEPNNEFILYRIFII